VYTCVRIALLHRNESFACRLLMERRVNPKAFAMHCISRDDPLCLAFVASFAVCFRPPALRTKWVCVVSAGDRALGCLRFYLNHRGPWYPCALLFAARCGDVVFLQLVLRHSKAWCPKVPGFAAFWGNVRFLAHIFAAGCPIWTLAHDVDPGIESNRLWEFFCESNEGQVLLIEDWALVVHPDIVRSGPVLLYAAQKGAHLTPRMLGMLGEVRARAQALANCFNRATRLSRARGVHARNWGAMGKVPVELIERIATLGKVSIAALDLVK
jgi:hypothetical protein